MNEKFANEFVRSQARSHVQAYGTIIERPITLEHREPVIDALNQTLADLITLRDLYKKHHWQVSGPSFYQLHLLFDKHHNEVEELVDATAERVQILGGVSVAMGIDAAELTRIQRPPRASESATAQILRLLEAHEVVIRAVRDGAKLANNCGDDGSNDLLIGSVLRTNEMHVWFLAEHLTRTHTFDETCA
jgi:starvation-inducible DNA-binding protein